MNTRLFIVEQYISWNGHYKKYFENLISEDYYYIYTAEHKQNYPNATFIPALKKEKSPNFLSFIKGRFLQSYTAYNKLIQHKPDAAHLIEFEPFSFLYLLLFKSDQIPKLVITVHSIERMKYANKLKDLVSIIQRRIYGYTLNKAASRGALFVTHYQHHKDQLVKLLGDEYSDAITLIPYPCPKPRTKINLKKDITNKKLLIYGQIREDKGIYEFLSKPGTEKLHITIAGPVLDPRILLFKNHNITFYNRYFNEEDDDLKQLIDSHSFMLLPYIKSYTGGSGTLKDSISFGLPIIASDIPTFREVIQQGQVGYIFDSIEDIVKYTETVDQVQYDVLVENCLKYSGKYNWDYMRQQYFNIYNRFKQ